MANSTQRCKKCKTRKRTEEMKRQGLSYVCKKCEPATESNTVTCQNTREAELSESLELGVELTRLSRQAYLKKGKAQKSKRVKERQSKKIRNSAFSESCTLRISPQCASNETVVLAHLGRSRGMALKSIDTMSCFSCSECHDRVDNRVKNELSELEIANAKLRAIEETHLRLIAKGLLVMK